MIRGNFGKIKKVLLMVYVMIFNKTLCTAYKSTVQTEQAMNLYKFVMPGLHWQQDDYTPVGQQYVLWVFLYSFLEHFWRFQCPRTILNMLKISKNGGNYL